MYLIVACKSGPILVYCLDCAKVCRTEVGEDEEDELVIQSVVESKQRSMCVPRGRYVMSSLCWGERRGG